MIAASVFISINILVLGISLYFDPSIFLDKVIIENDSLIILAQRLAACLIAVGIGVLIALFMQSVSMLKLAMSISCIITLQDTILGFAHDDLSLMIRSFFFCVLASFVLFIANGLKRKRKRVRFLKSEATSLRSDVDIDED